MGLLKRFLSGLYTVILIPFVLVVVLAGSLVVMFGFMVVMDMLGVPHHYGQDVHGGHPHGDHEEDRHEAPRPLPHGR
jgi:hypothetical protein